MTTIEQQLVELLRLRQATLATTADGIPNVGMVAFALDPLQAGLLIHVSQLAAHTRQLMAHGQVALMIMQPDDDADRDVQTLARVSMTGVARVVARDDAEYAALRDAYIRKFPPATMLFDFADFHLVRIAIDEARVVGGFAQARTLDRDAVYRAIQEVNR